MSFVMDGAGVLPELMRLGNEFLTGPLTMALGILIPLLSWAVIQGLIWIVRWLAKAIRKPARA
jgi:hypothetical protein